MLEREVIQMRGFRNTIENGTITGFQFRIRLTNYRGIWLSMLRPGELTVDGEKYDPDKISWLIDNKEYSPKEMEKIGDIQWHPSDAVVVKVKKPGGLAQGYHEVSYYYRCIQCYLPPSINGDEAFARIPPRIEARKLLIV